MSDQNPEGAMLSRTDWESFENENSTKNVKEEEEEDENELPGWMWDNETCSLPVRHLEFTDEKVVVRVYALAR